MIKFCTVLILVISLDCAFGMSKAQLKKTMTIMKKQCMPKIGVGEDKVGQIEQGVFIEDPKVMCYIACIYKTIQVVKNDRLNKDMVMKQVDILYPEEIKASSKAAIEKCIPVQEKYSDSCEGIFYAAKCLYEMDPPNFIFP